MSKLEKFITILGIVLIVLCIEIGGGYYMEWWWKKEFIEWGISSKTIHKIKNIAFIILILDYISRKFAEAIKNLDEE
jgi:hypothetical protein